MLRAGPQNPHEAIGWIVVYLSSFLSIKVQGSRFRT